MRRLTMCSVFALVAVSLSVPPVAGQEDPDEVPTRLLLAFVGDADRDADLFLGAPTDSVTALLRLDRFPGVVGGFAGDSGGVVVVELSGDLRDEMTRYGLDLMGEGWAGPLLPLGERGGFRPARPAPRDTWCSEEYTLQGAGLMVGERPYLRLRYGRREGSPSVCDNGRSPRFRPPSYAFGFPTLEPPPDAFVRPTGGGGNPSAIDMDVEVDTDQNAQVIFDHYAEQLEAAGWIPRERAASDDLVVGRWDALDEAGEVVVGVLGVWAMTSPDLLRAWLRMEREQSQR